MRKKAFNCPRNFRELSKFRLRLLTPPTDHFFALSKTDNEIKRQLKPLKTTHRDEAEKLASISVPLISCSCFESNANYDRHVLTRLLARFDWARSSRFIT